MYHDQGLTAFKALAMENGVNYTAGLPIVRTSPAHGTAYDIAGQGVADENSFRQAIYTALDIWRNRQNYDEARQNPLPKLYHDRREEVGAPRFRTPSEQTSPRTREEGSQERRPHRDE
jgi:4-hydroxythreonine-4-phosphate dehydrogenase